ncbi:jasmonate-induced oxygenase 4 [Impatiens glandulifera]|uniref:jasmonate-induced oxygenase 4 n=1 Tax=Impatiens glandulifera TaxID=253017 RepID=UPI001FB0DC82|nr:jasmonate-induced oxygenase 4 [Impatiens glandulifera]XP_047336293.1 jasmonate-induced oxygenase 4 [Impatiens glandulifera]
MEVVAEKNTRVQSLAQEDKPEVPREYIQKTGNRPELLLSSSNENKSVPSVDLSGNNFREELSQACREWGVFHVINHGVPDLKLLNDMRRIGRAFFEDLPMTEKLKYGCKANAPASEGYGSRMLVASDDAVLDWRDYFDHHTYPLSRRDPSRWPNIPSNYREIVSEYSDNMKTLAHRLMSLISESLGLQSSCIEEVVGEVYQNITISYYPRCPQPDLTLGLQTHSDMGVVTLLIQDDVGGLQVLKDGQWINVQTLPDAIVVLLGDQTEIISNGKYRSVEHRAVTNNNRARLSIAAFHDPAKDAIIRPACELISDSLPARYYQVCYGDYVAAWYTKGPEGKRNIDALLL